MTIHAFTPPSRMGTDTPHRYIPTRRPSGDHWIGIGLCVILLVICCASAFTGGLSVSTGGVEMNLTGSLSHGMQIHFASVNG
jgi:hypothetical protein